jgi:hypothetical protein
MGIRDRPRRLEERVRDRGPRLEEMQAAWGRTRKRSRAKLRGEPAPEGKLAQDRDVIDSWARAEGVDLEGEAELGREKLRTVDRARE